MKFIYLFSRSLKGITFPTLAIAIFMSSASSVWANKICNKSFRDLFDTSTIKLSRDYAKRAPSAAEIDMHLTAVHVTNFIPENGILSANKNLDNQKFRTTMHFSLGEMVLSHHNGNWDSSQFAVLIPFREIKSQVINVYHQDTFVFGKIKILPGATIVHPRGVKAPTIPGVKTIEYDPQSEKLRDVIRKTLVANDQWVFESSGAQLTDRSLLNGSNVNSASFFESILKDSGITWGMPEFNPIKSMNFRIVDLFIPTKEGMLSVDFTLNNWILERARFKHRIRLSEEMLKLRGLNIDQDDLTVAAFKDLRRYLKLIDLEILVQQKHGKTFMGSEEADALRKEIWQRLLEEGADLKMLEKHLDQLENPRQEEDRARALSSFEFYTQGFNKDEIFQLKTETPEIFESFKINLDEFFFKKRELREGYIKINKQQLSTKEKSLFLKELETNTTKYLLSEDAYRCFQWIFGAVQVKEFIPTLIKILKSPEVASRLEKHFDYEALLKIENSNRPTNEVNESFDR